MGELRQLCARVIVTLLIISCAEVRAETQASLEECFRRPPPSAGVRCFWWWLNGNVTKEAITRDLEQMQAKGFSGAMIFDAGGAEQRGNQQVPAGPTFLTPQWREQFAHAVREADRLGLELSLNIQSGWNLGGPPVTAEMAAKMLTWSETTVDDPRAFHGKIPQPRTRDGYYKDIALLAYRVKDAGANETSHAVERRPIRDLAAKAASKEIGMSAPDCRFLLTDHPATPGEEDVCAADILNISEHMDRAGQLTWDVPAGRWIILRFGYTPSRARVSTSSAAWQGRVIDYMSSEIFLQYWDAVVAPLLDDVGPLAGDSFKYLHTDSWECGGANWTASFPEEFRRRRMYDPIPYLPVIAGKIVDSRDVSNRFLADFRKTIGDCIAENHYGVFAELAHRHGMGIHPESGGPHAGPFDGLKCLGRSDIVMSEFWAPSPHRPAPEQRFFVKQASSVAHTYGRRIVAAEAFTSIGPHWDDVLWSSQKRSFDHEACSGLNLCFVHTFTCSPESMGLPGQEYFAGTHMNPNVTWWEMAGAFFAYLGRCQHMLRQGRFVADVCHYAGDHVPNLVPLKEADPAHVLPGYDYDVISEEALLTRLRFENGRLTLPDGMRYRILSLPDHKGMSVAALRAVAALVKAGATVIGSNPERTFSLTDYPQCDEQLSRLAEELWGAGSADSGARIVGHGRVQWGTTARDALAKDGVPPDFAYEARNGQAALDYIHRRTSDRDIYFLCNQSPQEVEAECLFRIFDRRAELWDPLTGGIGEAEVLEQVDGRTRLLIPFAPYGSWFVVFRAQGDPTSSSQRHRRRWAELRQLQGPWNVTFVSPWHNRFDVTMEVLRDWIESPEDRVRHHSGKAIYRHTFDMPAGECTGPARLMLDLGRVEDTGIARVVLNGRDLGVVWTKPFRVEVSSVLRAGANHLQVEVINSWRNRLIGDRRLLASQRRTATNIAVREDWELASSGLLGPIRLLKQTTD